MRVNIYAEEMTDRIEIISKEIEGQTFTGLRFYLELPVTQVLPAEPEDNFYGYSALPERTIQVRGPFMHSPGDDDSAAVTFWGKQDLREVLILALDKLNTHYKSRPRPDIERDLETLRLGKLEEK